MPFTMCAWFNTDVGNANQTIICYGDRAGPDNIFDLILENTGKELFAVQTSASAPFTATAAVGTWAANTWHHAAGVFTSTASRAAYLHKF